MPAQLLANVIRGDVVESVHTGHIAILDGEGNTLHSLGEPSTVTYFRSACKAFQLIPCITSGAADAFGFTDEQLAIAAASHSGESKHVRLVGQMLEQAGFSMDDLQCGTHSPFNEAEANRLAAAGYKPTPIHNNCSGKHAAMLAFAKHIGADPTTYLASDNRIQRRILKCIADFTEVPEDQIQVGVDGCAAPNFALPVSGMARAFASLVHPVELHSSIEAAANRVVKAMAEYPDLVGGTGRLDTMLMEAGQGKFISKVGADGVWLCGVLPSDRYPTGLGIAVKVADGDDHRGRPVVAVSILKQLGFLAEDALPDLSPMPVKNRRGEVVGRVDPVVSLERNN